MLNLSRSIHNTVLLLAGLWFTMLCTVAFAGAPAGVLSFTKSFGAASIPLNGSTTLTFVMHVVSPANGGITGLAFSDSLPGGLVVATPNGLSPTVCTSTAGVIAANAGGSTVSLSGGVVVGGIDCTFSVNVTGTTVGVKNNAVTTTAGNMSNGNQTANASLTVAAPPVPAPTLSEWAMILFALSLLSLGLHQRKKRAQ